MVMLMMMMMMMIMIMMSTDCYSSLTWLLPVCCRHQNYPSQFQLGVQHSAAVAQSSFGELSLFLVGALQ